MLFNNSTVSLSAAKKCCSSEDSKITSCCSRPVDEAIREKAYYLWEEAGCPESDGSNFWEAAKEFFAAAETR